MNSLGIIAAIVSGGLAGACVSILFNRLSHWRELRTKFHPKVNDLYAAYLIRMEVPEGRYWVTTVGNNPSSEDEEFVDHRSSFISEMVQFNELKEARVLRKRLVENMMHAPGAPGTISKLDLAPEFEALGVCLGKLEKKLGL
jgi:hypothetical protein